MTHKVIIESVTARNFRSIGDQPMTMRYTDHEHTLVVGEDNGSGKSTLLIHALYFLLYGKAYNDSDNKTSLINSDTRKNLVVEGLFNAKGRDIKVVRGQKPIIFEIHEKNADGEWVEKDLEAGLGSHQEMLDQLIGIDETSFCNCIALGVDKFKPFMHMRTAERRPFVERILGLEVFTRMSERLKDKIRETKNNLQDKEYDLKKRELELQSEEQILSVQSTNTNDQIASAKQSVDEAQSDVIAAEASQVDYKEKLDRVDLKISEVSDDIAKTTAEINQRHSTAAGDEESQFNATKSELVEARDSALAEFDAKSEDEQSAEKAVWIEKATNDVKAFDDGIAQAEKDVADLQQELKTAESGLRELEDKRSQITSSKRSVQAEVESVKSSLARTQKGIDDIYTQTNCPTCTQSIPESLKDESSKNLRDQRAELETSVEKWECEFDKVDGQLKEIIALVEAKAAQVNDVAEHHIKAAEALSAKRAERDEVASKVRGEAAEAIGALASKFKDKRRELEDELNAPIRELETNYRVACETRSSAQSRELSESNAANEHSLAKLNAIRSGVASSLQSATEEVTRSTQRLNKAKAVLEDLVNKPKFDFAAAEKRIADLQVQVEQLNGEVDALIKQTELNEAMTKVLSDKGIKASVIDKYLPYLNQRVNMYLHSMNLYLDLQMDNAFNISMNAPDRRGQTVYSLSNGQKARVNVAYMLAWRDIADMRSSVSANVLILDETLENVSENGVKETIDLVKQAAKGKNLSVVSQRNSEFEEHFNHKIMYALRDGQTIQLV